MTAAHPHPTPDEIRDLRQRLGERVRTTPVWSWRSRALRDRLGAETEALLKLELFQETGSFKPRGALANMLELDHEGLERGVTAVSAGNHALAVGYAASVLSTSAKVVMPETANPARVAGCRAWGAEVVLAPDVHRAFEAARRIEGEEGRTFIHPFEGYRTALGTATLGLELMEQAPGLEAVVVPIGGGGLCAGISAAVKQLAPDCRVYGVEPEGADTMRRSFAAGSPQGIDRVRTIADSLGAPHAEPYSFALCSRFVDRLVTITDDEMQRAMALLFREMKLAVEPAGAAATAALLGPLRRELRGHRVALVVCGSNIDPASFAHLAAGF